MVHIFYIYKVFAETLVKRINLLLWDHFRCPVVLIDSLLFHDFVKDLVYLCVSV